MYFAQPSFCVFEWCEFNFLKKYTKICVSFLIGNDGAKRNRLPWYLKIMYTPFISLSTLLFAEIGVAKLHTFWLLLRLKLGFFRIFFFSEYPFICGNWCSKIAYLLVIAQVETVLKFEGNPQLRSIV